MPGPLTLRHIKGKVYGDDQMIRHLLISLRFFFKPTKPTRRGKHGGLREIERKILKENTI